MNVMARKSVKYNKIFNIITFHKGDNSPISSNWWPGNFNAFFPHEATAQSGQALSCYRGYTITLKTHHTRQYSSGRVISPMQIPLNDKTQHSQQTNIHAPGEIRTQNLRQRADADSRLRPRGNVWHQIYQILQFCVSTVRVLSAIAKQLCIPEFRGVVNP